MDKPICSNTFLFQMFSVISWFLLRYTYCGVFDISKILISKQITTVDSVPWANNVVYSIFQRKWKVSAEGKFICIMPNRLLSYVKILIS